MKFVLTEKPNGLTPLFRKHEGHDLEICVFPGNLGGSAQLIDYDDQSVILDGAVQDLFNGQNVVSLDRILRKSTCRCVIRNGELRRQLTGTKVIRGQEKFEVIKKGERDGTNAEQAADAEILEELEEEETLFGKCKLER